MFGSGTAASVIKSFSAKLPNGIAQHLSCAEGRTVVVLINVPLGLNDVNPMYYNWHSRQLSIVFKLHRWFSSDNLFHLDSHNPRATILSRPPTQAAEREHGVPISHTVSSTFSYQTVLPFSISKQIPTSSSSLQALTFVGALSARITEIGVVG